VGLTPARRRSAVTRLKRLNPLFWFVRWADWFEARGVYVPGEDSRSLSTWRDFGWLIAGWLLAVSAYVVFFALAT
jgi:hypothetical protein